MVTEGKKKSTLVGQIILMCYVICSNTISTVRLWPEERTQKEKGKEEEEEEEKEEAHQIKQWWK